MVTLEFYRGLSANAKDRAEVVKLTIKQKDIPIAMTWNGETAGYIVSAEKWEKHWVPKCINLMIKGTIYYLLMNPKTSFKGSVMLQVI